MATTTTPSKDLQRDRVLAAQLELFAIRAGQIFDRVLTGNLLLIDGVNLLHDASVASGLDASVGTDAIQKLLAACFASASAEHDRINQGEK